MSTFQILSGQDGFQVAETTPTGGHIVVRGFTTRAAARKYLVDRLSRFSDEELEERTRELSMWESMIPDRLIVPAHAMA
jgi:hypothetical protein